MSPLKAQHPGADPAPAPSADEPTPEGLRPRLMAATKEELAALVERLAGGSAQLAARIDYLTNRDTAAKALQQQITAIRRGKRFIAYGESREVAEAIATIVEDVRIDVLPKDPEKAMVLAEKLICLDQVIFDRADDSDGLIGDELRVACVLWLDAAAAVRATYTEAAKDWPAAVYALYQSNDYGVREPLLEQGHRLMQEAELRALAARFESDTREALEASKAGRTERHRTFGPSSAMGLVARALRDPRLYEQSILVHSPKPNALQAHNIAEQYLACGEAAGALRWLRGACEESSQFERFDLLDQAYELLGDREQQIKIRTQIYQRSPGIHSYRALEQILPPHERSAFRARACQEAATNPNVASAAELLFALEEPALAEQVIIERSAALDGRNYGVLTALVKTAQAQGRLLAAALIWRALIDAILARGYAKAYGHAARYLIELRALSAKLEDYRGHPRHESYEAALRHAHRRKASFWEQLN
jgi:hypothetical protein